MAIAVPIWGPTRAVMSDLVVSLPEYRFTAKMELTLARVVIQHAKRISERLGAQAPAHKS